MVGDPETQLSADGSWWWDGGQWVPAVSEDGLWRWDGKAWRLGIAADESDPQAVAAALDRLADERFTEGGHLLALRSHEWRPRTDELARLVLEAAPLAARLAALDAQLSGVDGPAGRSGFRSLLGGDDRPQHEAEARRIEEQLRPLAALIGRTAPQPSLKDADTILVPARRLHERVLALQQALAEQERLAAEHGSQVASARAEVEQARAAREVALSAQSARVREREAEQQRAVAELAEALRRLRMPGPGTLLARFQGLALHEDRVDTPDGRGPVAGARAVQGTARELAQAEGELVGELFRLEATGAGALHEALTLDEPRRFLLVATTRAVSVVPVPAEAASEADAFAEALETAAAEGGRRREAWARQVAAAEAALEAALADTSLVDEARAELERAEADPDLAAPVEDAERRLRTAEEPGPELAAAQARVDELLTGLLTRPPALEPAAAG